MLRTDRRPQRSVRLPRFARTITFKLALVQACLFAVTAAVLFGAVYLNLADYARMQLRASISAELAPLVDERATDGLDQLVGTIEARTRASGDESFRYLFEDADGHRLAGALPAGSVRLGWQDIPENAIPGRRPHPLEAFGQRLPTGEFIAVARDLGDVVHLKEQVIRSFGIAAGLALFLAIVGGVVTSLSALRRVEAINGITRGIMEGDLGRRVPLVGTGDEFDRLAANTNAMLDRIQLLMEGLRQVSNDIAHDLRTPLTHLGQRLEAARGGPKSVEAYEAAIEAASGDVDTILRIFASLLRIAQIEAGARRSGFADLDLSALFCSIGEAFAPVAEDAGQSLTAIVEPGLHCAGDRDLLTQMLANLVENAIRHAGPGAAITISLARDGAGFVGEVADTGPGIPAAERVRVFGRFVRLEASRPGEGHGLGLAMVKAVADLHGLTLSLSDAEPGLRVTMH